MCVRMCAPARTCRLLDPGSKLFASVVAKDHSRSAVAKDLDVLLSADEVAVILDDTEAVWPSHRANLLQVGGWEAVGCVCGGWGGVGWGWG